MVTSRGRSHGAAVDEAVLRSFDLTARSVFQLLCRLTDGELERVQPLLVNVYVTLASRRAAEGGNRFGGQPIGDQPIEESERTGEIELIELQRLAFELADDSNGGGNGGRNGGGNGGGWVRNGLSTLDRALANLEDRCAVDEIATIVGRPADDVAVMLEDLHDRFDASGGIDVAREALRASDRWLDDATLEQARAAIGAGAMMPVRRSTTNVVGGALTVSMPKSALTPTATGGWEDVDRGTGHVPAEPRRRRLMVMTTLAIVAALGAAALWVAPGDDDRDDSAELTVGTLASSSSVASATSDSETSDSETSTPRPTTPRTTDAPTTTIGPRFAGPKLELSPGFILGQPIAGFTVASLWESVAEESNGVNEYRNMWYQLWVEPDATGSTGRWIGISTGPSGQYIDLNVSPTIDGHLQRIGGNGWQGVLRRDAGGSMGLSLELGDPTVETPLGEAPVGMQVEVQGSGFTLEELITIATSMVRDPPSGANDAPDPLLLPAVRSSPGPEASALLSGLAIAESGPTGCCGVSGLQRQNSDSRFLQYTGGGDRPPVETISIDTWDDVGETTLGMILATPRTLDPDFPTNASATLIVGRRLVHVSGYQQLEAGEVRTWHTGRWVEDGKTVSVTVTGSVARLIEIIDTVRPATVDEWLQLNEDAAERRIEGPVYVDPMSGPRVDLGHLDLDDDNSVSVVVNATATAANISLESDGGTSSGYRWGWSYDPNRAVAEFSSAVMTVLLIAVPAQPAGTMVRVTVGGRQRVIELTPVADSGIDAAFDAFSELPPYTVELVDPVGNVVASLVP